MRVLLVDDSASHRSLVKVMLLLPGSGLEVLEAGSAGEAMTMVAYQRAR